jgi:hypothetical protein
MPKVLTFYSVTYVVFLSNKQPQKNKRHDLLFIKKSKIPFKLVKYQFAP